MAHCGDVSSNRSIIDPEAGLVLSEAVHLLRAEDAITIVIDEPIDGRHGETYHLFLARRRAKAVRRHLIDHGIAANHITLRDDPQTEAGAITPAGDLAHSQPVELYVE